MGDFGRTDFPGVDRVLDEVDPERRLGPFRERLGDDWGFVLDYVTAELRATLELGTMIRSLLDVAEARGHVGPEVAYWFRSNQTFRSRNFGVADDRDSRFMELALSPRGEGLLGCLENTRQAGERRLFESGGLEVVNPPPLGKRLPLDLPGA